MRPVTPGDARVAILLATYNGDRYLDELVRSLVTQTYQDFIILARDDHSTDATPTILAHWAAEYPDKIRIISDELGNLRSLGNFARLMELCDTPYFAFCDQDDVWLANKLERAVTEIRHLESQFGAAMPILVHSDRTLVDGSGHQIAPSFFDYARIDLRTAERLDHLIINNIVAGCASLGNRALLDMALPIPAGVPFHDWWVTLLAASRGVLKTIPEPTILWRQHGANQVGAGRRQGGSTLWEARHVLRRPGLLTARIANALGYIVPQANALLRVAGDKMPRRHQEFLRAFCLPRNRDEAVRLALPRRVWLTARYLAARTRALPLLLRWCY